MNLGTSQYGKRKSSCCTVKPEDVTVDDTSEDLVKDSQVQKKKIRHSIGSCRDLDWQRCMEGFTGINIKMNTFKQIRYRSSNQNRDFTKVNQLHSPDTQQEIDDWPTSDEDQDQESITDNEVGVANGSDDVNTIITTTSESDDNEECVTGRHQEGILKHLKGPAVKEVQSVNVIDDSSESDDVDEGNSNNDDVETVSEERSSLTIHTSDSQTSLQQTQTNVKPKASEWIKNISWKPVAEEKMGVDEVFTEVPFKRKNTKYLKGGLAERLYKLIQQERSSRTFYSHKVQSTTVLAKSAAVKNICVQIKHVQRDQSVVTTRSCVLEKSDVIASVAVGEHMFIMFAKDTWLEHKLGAGVKLRINAPWQILKQPDGSHVILCTHHIEVITRLNQSVASDHVPAGEQLCTIASWLCPCNKDESLKITQCPACTQPVHVQRICLSEQGSGLENRARNAENSHIKLESLASSAFTNTYHSLLMAIERKSQGVETTISFVATVQRILQKRAKDLKNSFRINYERDVGVPLVFTLLLQDFCGFLCELVLPLNAEDKEPWKSLIKEGEGSVFEFQRLYIIQRVNRNKSSQLFTMIDSVWSHTSVTEMPADSEDSEQKEIIPAQLPLFSYVLEALAGETTCVKYHTQKPSIYFPKVVKPFSTVLAMFNSEELGRCTVEGRVIYEKVNKQGGLLGKLVYIISKYEEAGYLKVVIPESASYKVAEGRNKCFLLQDILIGKGQCIIDEYSSVCDSGTPFPMLMPRVVCRLPEFTVPAKVDSLFSLQGTLCDVDELTAYSWLACDQCNNEKLQGGTAVHPFLYCAQCERGVTKPVKRMNLDIFLSAHGFDELTVKVKLLQSTTEALLPKDDADDEGYDIQTVIGKPVGPIPVIVVSAFQKQYLLEEIKVA